MSAQAAIERDRGEEERMQAWICQIVASAQSRGFYGEVRIEFKGGVVRNVVKTEMLRPPQ